MTLGVNEPIDYVFLRVSGGRRGGKSASGALRAINYMVTYPGSLGLITAPIYDNITAATFPALEKFLKLAGLRRGQEWEYIETRKELIVHVGGGMPDSRAYIRTTEHPENLPGADLAWFWMDEARRSPFAAWQALQPALTQQGFPHSAWVTTTPAGRRHWMVKLFDPDNYLYDEGEEPIGERPGIYKTYRALTKDNPHGGKMIHAQTVAALGGENSLLARQELYGEDVILEGLLFPTWNPERYIKPVSEWPSVPDLVVAGVDFGFSPDPFAILIKGYDTKTERGFVMDEFMKDHMSEDDVVEVCKKFQDKYNIRYMFCDSSNPGVINHMARRGLHVRKAVKDVSLGLGVCTTSLNSLATDGSQGFFVNPKCRNFIQQIEGFTDDSQTKRVAGHHFDMMAAWRYAEMGLSKLTKTGGRRSIVLADLRIGGNGEKESQRRLYSKS